MVAERSYVIRRRLRMSAPGVLRPASTESSSSFGWATLGLAHNRGRRRYIACNLAKRAISRSSKDQAERHRSDHKVDLPARFNGGAGRERGTGSAGADMNETVRAITPKVPGGAVRNGVACLGIDVGTLD